MSFSISTPLPRPEASRTLQLLLLTVAASAAVYARTTVSPLQEAMRVALELSDNQIAMLQGPALAIPMIIAAIPLGLTVDRYSRVRLLLAFAMLNVAGSILSAVVSSFPLLFLARSVVGITTPATAMTALSIIADLYSPAARGRANMIMAVGQVGGMSAAFGLGGALLSGSGTGVNGWRSSMLWMSVPLVVVMFLVLGTREPVRKGAASVRLAGVKAFTELWRYRAMLAPLLAGQVMVGMADAAVLIWASPALSRGFALPPDRVGSIMAMALLVSGLAGPLAGGFVADLSQRAGGPRLTIGVLSGLSLLSVPAGLFAIAPSVPAAGALIVLFMTIGYAISVIAGTLFTVVIPNELRGLCISVSVTASLLFCLGLAPVTVSMLSTVIGGPTMIGAALAIVCAAISLFGAAVFTVGRRHFSAGAGTDPGRTWDTGPASGQ